MNISFLQEPELEFGNGGRHIDIRFGMMHYKPLDYDTTTSPKEIKLGIVGSSETVEGLETWLEKCKHGIDAKNSKQPHLFPQFPGFGEDNNLPASINTDSKKNAILSNKDIENLLKYEDVNTVINETVNFLIEELRYIRPVRNILKEEKKW